MFTTSDFPVILEGQFTSTSENTQVIEEWLKLKYKEALYLEFDQRTRK
jgi:hypothetical protein